MPFSSIIGHDRIVSLLKRSLAAGRVSHAYLFEGVDRHGMRTTALALAEAIFCNGVEGCGNCPSCRKTAGKQHPDLHFLEPDGAFIKIDQIRNLQKELSYRPFEAHKKVCIIEDAERMNPAAANAFLKTLEEPPGDALLLLLTSHAESVLPTILSRCQRLRFPSLPADTIVDLLRRNGVEEETARIAAALAGGDPARAEEITSSDRLRLRRHLLERMETLSTEEIAPLFAAAEEYSRDKETSLDLVDILRLFWRDVLLLLTDGEGITNRDYLPLIRSMAERHTMEQVMDTLDLISRTRQALMRNVNPRLAVEVLFMGLNQTNAGA